MWVPMKLTTSRVIRAICIATIGVGTLCAARFVGSEVVFLYSKMTPSYMIEVGVARTAWKTEDLRVETIQNLSPEAIREALQQDK